MDCVGASLSIGLELWRCTGKGLRNIQDLEENLQNLSRTMDELNILCEDVKTRVQFAEQHNLKRTSQVHGWLEFVQVTKEEVDQILMKGHQELETRCFRGSCPKNFWVSYKLGKLVKKKLIASKKLLAGGHFHDVAHRPADEVVVERPLDPPVGFEYMFEKVWRYVEDGNVRSIGLFGMGGVGKTTLLKKIHNELTRISHDYDLVVWIVVSRPANLEKIQKAVWQKLNLLDGEWDRAGREDRASKILAIMKHKKFLLFLDDIWESIDLSDLGIPSREYHQKKSKVIFTTRSKQVCSFMRADKSIQVECLPPGKAIELFRDKVGTETWFAHPHAPELAKIMADECKGLPLALITVGRAMSGRKSPYEWRHAIQVLKRYPSKLSGMEHEVFIPLEFSYDSLPDEIHKRCFLYCSIFPEDHEIHRHRLIELWIGEGFLDDYDKAHDARNYGENIIGSLLHACLLEDCKIQGHPSVKMHDVVRDMALWIASGRELMKRKTLVRDDLTPVDLQEFEKWKNAERISLWRVDQINQKFPGTLSFPNLSTLLLKKSGVKEFPDGFFSSMPVLRVLDLSENPSLSVLPENIGLLLELQYLNVGMTAINQLSSEVKNLTKLRFLAMNRRCQPVSKEVMSSLSSLRVIHWFCGQSNEGTLREIDEVNMIEMLQAKKDLSEISLQLSFPSSALELLKSPELCSCLRDLALISCKDLTQLSFSTSSFDRMEHLDVLKIFNCNFTEINIAGMMDVGFDTRHHIGFFQSAYFCSLREVRIGHCHHLRDLTLLIYNAPSLEKLRISDCTSMVELINDDIEESYGSRIFQCLISLSLQDLPKLQSICRRHLNFPSLMEIGVLWCPSLKKLPLTRETANKSHLRIEGYRHWWDELHWDDRATKEDLSAKFIDTWWL